MFSEAISSTRALCSTASPFVLSGYRLIRYTAIVTFSLVALVMSGDVVTISFREKSLALSLT
jgi:hypothetical protein